MGALELLPALGALGLLPALGALGLLPALDALELLPALGALGLLPALAALGAFTAFDAFVAVAVDLPPFSSRDTGACLAHPLWQSSSAATEIRRRCDCFLMSRWIVTSFRCSSVSQVCEAVCIYFPRADLVRLSLNTWFCGEARVCFVLPEDYQKVPKFVGSLSVEPSVSRFFFLLLK